MTAVVSVCVGGCDAIFDKHCPDIPRGAFEQPGYACRLVRSISFTSGEDHEETGK